MTLLRDAMGDGRPEPLDARSAATRAAAAAGVTVRPLDAISEFHAVIALFDRIWQRDATASTVNTELLRALSKAGGYVAGAYAGGELVGACVGFFGAPSSASMHSHIAGVSTRNRGGSVGFALKVHQRAWALQSGVREIGWTFDPLVARNAHFNLSKLGADATEYLEDFYGPMGDSINTGDDTDRLLVRWRLEDDAVAAACAGHPQSAPVGDGFADVALVARPDGRPEVREVSTTRVRVAVPSEIERLRAEDPVCAASWRRALRQVLGALLADGGRVVGFERAGYYVVDRAAGRPGPDRDATRGRP